MNKYDLQAQKILSDQSKTMPERVYTVREMSPEYFTYKKIGAILGKSGTAINKLYQRHKQKLISTKVLKYKPGEKTYLKSIKKKNYANWGSATSWNPIIDSQPSKQWQARQQRELKKQSKGAA